MWGRAWWDVDVENDKRYFLDDDTACCHVSNSMLLDGEIDEQEAVV